MNRLQNLMQIPNWDFGLGLLFFLLFFCIIASLAEKLNEVFKNLSRSTYVLFEMEKVVMTFFFPTKGGDDIYEH